MKLFKNLRIIFVQLRNHLNNNPYPSSSIPFQLWEWEWSKQGKVKYLHLKTLEKYLQSQNNKFIIV